MSKGLVILVNFVTWLSVITVCISCQNGEQVDKQSDFFVKYYGEAGDQKGVDLLVDEAAKQLIMLGTTTLGEENRLYVVKTDWNGNLIWKKKLGGNSDVGKDIEFSNDGGYIILSQSSGINGDVADLKLLKVSLDGIKTDSVVFGFQRGDGSSANEFPYSVAPINDGYMVMGYTDLDSTTVTVQNYSDILHVKFDENLDAVPGFNQYSSLASRDLGIKAVQLGAGNIYVFASSSNPTDVPSSIDDDLNFWYFGISNEGLISSASNSYFGTDAAGVDEVLTAVCPAFSPGYFLVGSYTTGTSNSDIYFAKVFENGTQLQSLSGSGRLTISNRKIKPVSVCQSAHSSELGYLILANEGDSGTQNIWLTKVNESGAELWSYSFGAIGGNDDTAGAVAELPDGTIVIVGTINIGDENELKMTLLKLNDSGKLAE